MAIRSGRMHAPRIFVTLRLVQPKLVVELCLSLTSFQQRYRPSVDTLLIRLDCVLLLHPWQVSF